MVQWVIQKKRLSVDAEKTKQLYAARHVCDGISPGEQNFLRNVLLRRAALDRLFGKYGIRPDKCRNLQVMDTDPYQQTVTYIGEYPIAAELKEDAGNEASADFGQDEWEETECGFSLSCRKDQTEIVIEFMADLPWLMLPPIRMPRYINQAVLPDKWMEWNVWRLIEMPSPKERNESKA